MILTRPKGEVNPNGDDRYPVVKAQECVTYVENKTNHNDNFTTDAYYPTSSNA
jgi:hypothetical protein